MVTPFLTKTPSTMILTSIVREVATSTITNTVLAERTDIVEKLPPSVGPIPLAAFIPMCFFAPFLISFATYLFYTYTIKRCRDKRHIKTEAQAKDAETDVNRDVEMQVAGFVQAPAPTKTLAKKGRRRGDLEPVEEERSAPIPPEHTGSPLKNQVHFNAY